ncbi:MAG: acyltransferase [bacterium]|nr:acyltransferase [bacterium]
MTDNTQKIRKSSIEILRFLACCGIVWFHAGAPGSYVAYGGLPVFMILSVAFAAQKQMSFSAQFTVSSKRILLPWIFWSGFYALAIVGEAFISKTPLTAKFHSWMMFTGTSLHLWYLPVAFVTILLISLVKSAVSFKPRSWYSIFWALISSGLLLYISWIYDRVNDVTPYAQWIFLAASIPLGLFFAAARSRSLVGFIFRDGMWLLLVSCAIPLFFGLDRIALPYLVAILGCTIAWIFNNFESPFVTKLGNLTYGVYLIHAIFISIWIRIGIEGRSAALIIVVIITSLIGSYIIQKTPFRRFT